MTVETSLILIGSVAAGVLAGWLFGLLRKKLAGLEAKRILEEARKDAEAITKETRLHAKEELLHQKETLEKENEGVRQELKNHERRLQKREDVLDSKVEIITKCTFLAERKMEEVRASALFSFDDLNSMELDGYFPSPDERYYFKVDYSSSGDLMTATVTAWLDKDGNEELDGGENSVLLETKIADRG